jgi:hypothetical protein
VPPASALGKKFAVTRSPQRSTADDYVEVDVWRILADKPGTTVTTSLPAPWSSFTLDENQMVEFWSQTNFVLEASEPVLLAQFLVSQDSGPGTGDPSLTFMPPVDQARAQYVFLVPETYDKNYAVVGRATGASVKIDDQEVPGEFGDCQVTAIGTIGTTSYEALVCPLEAGIHRLVADQPVSLVAYGYGMTGSIAYVGGADVKQINMQ